MATPAIDPTDRRRSPSFPSFGLEQALDAVRKIYDEDRQVSTLRETAAKHIGYAGNNGSAARMLASLAHYGLIEEAGQGKIRVTESGKALLHPKDSTETFSMLKQAIEKPKVFNHLITKYGLTQMPSQETLKNELIREMHFNKEAAEEVLRALKLSISYVGSAEIEIPEDTKLLLKVEENENVKPDEGYAENNRKDKNNFEQWIDGPLSSQTRAELRVWGPIGPNEANRLKRWLDNIVKPWADFHVLEDEDDN